MAAPRDASVGATGRRSAAPADDRPVTAFVLPGGSTLGAVQVGMLQVLVAAGIVPDLIVATSVGALNAAVFVNDPSPAGIEHLEHLWTRAPRSQIFPFTPIAVARALVRRQGHLLDNDGLRRWIAESINFDRLEDAPRPLHVMATEAERHVPVVLSSGDSVTALLASTALPGVFPAVWFEGQRLVDGGGTANVPVPQAQVLGAERIIVLPTDGGHPSPAGPHQIRRRLHRLLDHAFGQPAAADPVHDDLLTGAPPAVVYEVPAPPTRDTNPFSFRHAGRLIEESTALSERWIANEGAALLS